MYKKDLVFTRGNGDKVTYDKMIALIGDFVIKDPFAKYEFTVGTDSQNADHTKMVEVIAIHRVGNGGIFFYRIEMLISTSWT